jgi:DNA-binding CsgD family transcriptional regulator
MDSKVSKEVRDSIDGFAGLAFCKDEHSVFQYTNPIHGKLIGLRHHMDIIGGTDFDIPCDVVACADAFQEQDRLVMSSGKEFKILDIHPFADGQWGVYLSSKKPWLDKNNKVIGTMLRGQDITNAYTMAFSTQLAKFTGHQQDSYTLTQDGDAITEGAVSLSPRESEVLFLILRGKTAKLAATVLGLSYRTVQQYIDSLKEKFHVESKIELIDAAMAQGFMSQIPLSIFSKQLSVALAAE